MNIGAMDKLVIVEKSTSTQNPTTGAITKTWSEYTRIYGDYQPLSTKDILAAQAIKSTIQARLLTHLIDDVDSTMRVRIMGLNKNPKGSLFAIDGNPYPDNRNNRTWLNWNLKTPEAGWV